MTGQTLKAERVKELFMASEDERIYCYEKEISRRDGFQV